MNLYLKTTTQDGRVTKPPSPRCRLCLTTFHDPSDNLQDMFRDEEAHFSLKVRDCTGVYVSQENDSTAATTVCTNCTETVHFIAEFRDLCRRSEEQYEGLLVEGEGGFDPSRWEAYRHHVGELRRLLSTTGEDSEDGNSRSMVAVKLEEEDGERQVDMTFEWADAGDELEVKQEFDDDEEYLEEEKEEYVPKRKRAKVGRTVDQMALAKAIHEHPALWDLNHNGFHDAGKRDQAWEKLASTIELDKAQLKSAFNRLHDIYRRKRWNSEASGDELYQLLESMFSLRKVRGQVAGFSTTKGSEEKSSATEEGERMKLAEAIYEKEIIWNRVHPQYNSSSDREGAFEELAVKLNKSAANLKQEWRKLRDWYRFRWRSALEGKLGVDDPKLKDLLYLLLRKMLRDNMDVGKFSDMGNEKSTADDPGSNIAAIQNDKLALAQAFYEREFIWNPDHPQNATKVSREAALKKTAQELNMSLIDVKNQWRYLRDGYRVKWKRLQARPHDATAINATLNPLYQLMDQMNPVLEPATSPCRPRADIKTDHRLAVVTAIHGQEILWNRTHPDFADYEKRDETWQQVATALSIPFLDLKNQWKILRDLYRNRILRSFSGKIPPNHPLLRQKLFQLLDRMLADNMDVGKRSLALRRRLKNTKVKEEDEGDGEGREVDLELSEQKEEEEEVVKWGKPFDDKELRARLAEEITKHEMLWNVNHVDYSRGSLRGKLWTEIGNLFGLDRGHAIMAWRRATHRHRRLVELHGAITPELLEQDPLHRMLHDVVFKAAQGDDATEAEPKILWPPKRRYTGKRSYSDEGCTKVIHNGTPHYFRVCELCGKSVERSDFEYHMNRHNGLTPYACSYEGCGKAYGSKITRDRHEILIHTADAERFECEECGEKFRYRSKLEYHHAINHKSQNLPCPTCGKELKHKQALQNHMQKVHQHSGFACSAAGCGRVLQTKYSLNVHMRIHTNEKPYPCVLCGQSFRLKVLLKTHLAKKHNVAIEELEGPGPSGGRN